MDNAKAKSEGAAYLAAAHIKESFHPTEADFLPANLEGAVAKVTKLHEDLEGHYEKLATEELQREFALIRKEIKNYLVVLKSIHDIEGKDQQAWLGVSYFLQPTQDVENEPSIEQQQAAKKILQRFAGFSTNATGIIEGLIKKRTAHEEEKMRKHLERRKKQSSSGGFFAKLGIKF
ncbi:MAG: hypothetical protein G8345_15390 [Magnetococcales bacterium]|nr:hypothetical protein [Magnetococcales bacterium]NGZ28261.1 hypothetical protein [Magnetococcales bacterium]